MRKRLHSIRLALIVLLPMVVYTPSRTLAQSVSVSPNCGTRETHFILGGGGLVPCPKTCPDSCHVTSSVAIDGNTIFRSPDCQLGFTIDLQDVPGVGCVACTLSVGVTHTVRFEGDTELANYPAIPHQCAMTTFHVVTAAANGDPWTDGLSTSSDSQYVYVNFNPCGICDVAPCDSILFIAVIRPRKQVGGQLLPMTYAEQGFPKSAARDAQVTQAGFAVDVPPSAPDPYCLPKYKGMPLYSVGSRDGSCHAAECTDSPSRGPLSYQPEVEKIVLDFEVHAQCVAGEGLGQWLGGCTFSWERSQIAPGTLGPARFKFDTCTRASSSQQFQDALKLWQSLHHEFSLPLPQRPSSGGVACN